MTGADAELDAIVEAITDETWDRLPDVISALAGDNHPYEWCGGDQRPDGAWSTRWVEYGASVEGALDWIRRAGLVTPVADWMNWDERGRYLDPRAVDEAPIADIVRLATAIVRGERFGDGTIANAVDSGVLDALLRHLLRWQRTRHTT